MILRLKELAKRILPAAVLRKIRHYKNPLFEADLDAAWNFKREFFWCAFKALDFNGIDGDYVEFGSYSGMTFRLAFDETRRRNIKRHMWAFDSFQGLPHAASSLDNHPRWKEGSMAMGVDEFREICRKHSIPEDGYTIVEGFYAGTLAQMPAKALPTNIALAYIDCDMYSSAKTVLEFLKPRLKHGMILAFDDYFCWSPKLISGERKAFLDVLAGNKKWDFVRYRNYSWGGLSFVVERAGQALK